MELKTCIKIILFLYISITCWITYIYYQKYNSQTYFQGKEESQYIKTFKILTWTKANYGPDWLMKGSEPFKYCKYKNCFGTSDRNQYNTSDIILFQFINIRDFPEYRFPNQKWVMHQHESPAMQRMPSRYNNIFNATWTYHKKSDIWTNYSHPDNIGGIFKKIQTSKALKQNYANGKSSLAAWMVSQCNRPCSVYRENYVNNLQQYMPVDIYGKCGTLSCGKSFRYAMPIKDECLNMIEKKYKFYLSFENSLCDYYVTEKIWNILKRNLIPVVFGAFDYSNFFPPKSFINIKDFSSPKRLAQYLLLLDKNDAMYNEYFQWKNEYEIIHHLPFQCEVCEYVNKSENITKTYEKLDQFWNNFSDCHHPKDIFPAVKPKSWL